MSDATLYDKVGGDAFFQRLVDAFYEGVVHDPVLWPLYPDPNDLDGAKSRLTLFLIQYWGGPMTYMEVRGHPKLRLRHMPYPIGPRERDHWLAHMASAVERCAPDESVRSELMEYFVSAAEHLRNDTGLPISSSKPSAR